MTTIVLIALATACIVNTVHTSLFFDGFRKWLFTFGEPEGWRRWTARGIMCAYCFSHWVALPMALTVLPFEPKSVISYFAAVWLAAHSMALYFALTGLSAQLQRGSRP
jgi:hypothetical protein